MPKRGLEVCMKTIKRTIGGKVYEIPANQSGWASDSESPINQELMDILKGMPIEGRNSKGVPYVLDDNGIAIVLGCSSLRGENKTQAPKASVPKAQVSLDQAKRTLEILNQSKAKDLEDLKNLFQGIIDAHKEQEQAKFDKAKSLGLTVDQLKELLAQAQS